MANERVSLSAFMTNYTNWEPTLCCCMLREFIWPKWRAIHAWKYKIVFIAKLTGSKKRTTGSLLYTLLDDHILDFDRNVTTCIPSVICYDVSKRLVKTESTIEHVCSRIDNACQPHRYEGTRMRKEGQIILRVWRKYCVTWNSQKYYLSQTEIWTNLFFF